MSDTNTTGQLAGDQGFPGDGTGRGPSSETLDQMARRHVSEAQEAGFLPPRPTWTDERVEAYRQLTKTNAELRAIREANR